MNSAYIKHFHNNNAILVIAEHPQSALIGVTLASTNRTYDGKYWWYSYLNRRQGRARRATETLALADAAKALGYKLIDAPKPEAAQQPQPQPQPQRKPATNFQPEDIARHLPEVGTPILNDCDAIDRLLAEQKRIAKEIDEARVLLQLNIQRLWTPEQIESAKSLATDALFSGN